MSRVVQVVVIVCCGPGCLPQVGKARSNHNSLQWGKQDSNLRRQSHQIYSLAHLATLEFPRSPPHALTQSGQVSRKPADSKTDDAGQPSLAGDWPLDFTGCCQPTLHWLLPANSSLAVASQLFTGCCQPTREIFGLAEKKLHPREPSPLLAAPPVTTPPAVFEAPGVWIPRVAVEATTGS
jgi:hypothetical protein